MKITTIHNHTLGTVKATADNLETVRAEYEAQGYKVSANLGTHIENGKYVFGGYKMKIEADMIFSESNITIEEHVI
jgi:hypothetical protein